MQAHRSARGWKSLPEHFRGQAAAAHAEHHRVFETLADKLLAQGLEVRNPFLHAIAHLKPAQPVADLGDPESLRVQADAHRFEEGRGV